MTIPSARKVAPGQFDFALDAAQEARAAKLHRESIIVDLLSQYAGGNIFDHFPEPLRHEFLAVMGEATGLDGVLNATYWPFEMSKLGKSDLIREWLQVSGLTCGTYDVGV